MELRKDAKNEEMDLGFKCPPKGDYVWQFTEGIDLHTNEEKGTRSIKIPLQVIEVIKGDEDAILGKGTLWPGVDSAYGEKQLLGILTMTGLLDSAIKNFGEDIDPGSEKFVNFLKLKLPGKLVCASHIVQKSKSKKNPEQELENVNFTKMWKHGKSAATSGKKAAGGDDEFVD